ncbi:MAG: aldo/keto reductase [Lachnospiraceae bacterium]|nr:aldo/keto reductase [Lachnospiraceae bacterium]
MEKDVFYGAKKLGFGLMRLPLRSSGKDDDIDMEQTKRMVDLFLERGFTYFDTAWMYCGFQSENAAKEALVDRHPRESFTLATKLHHGFIETEEDRDRIFEEQLKKTGVEYFDYYLVHDISSHSIEKYRKLHVFDWIQKKKEQGLVKHIGFSYHDGPELLDEILGEQQEMEFVQIQLNYLDYDSPAVRSRECYEVAEKHDKPVVIMEPVKGGTLTNLPDEILEMYKACHPEQSAASWAIRFAASHKNVRMVLSGMSSMEQLEDNTSYMKEFMPLDEKERELIKKAVGILNRSIAIPCTACSYCTEGCPEKIAIPKYFSLYNAELKENPDGKKGWTPQMEYYGNLTNEHGKASACIECRQCENICPQHLEIVDYLKTVAERFE